MKSRPFLLRRGALLVEVVLALAIFVMAGGAIVNLLSQSMLGVDRSREQARAADLARSAMAKIEAGIETPQTLSGPLERSEEGATQAGRGWELEIDTDASQFRGLTRVTVTALKRSPSGAAVEASFKLVQLVRLGSKGEDSAGEEDSITERARRGMERAPSRGEGGGR